MSVFPWLAGQLPVYTALTNNLKNTPSATLLVGASEVHKAHLIGAAQDLSRQILVITPDEAAAVHLLEDLNAMYPEKPGVLYPSRSLTLRQGELPSREFEQQRLGVLARLQSGDCKLVVAPVEALLQQILPPETLEKRHFELSLTGSYTLPGLISNLLAAGYEQVPQVEGVAQFSVRGGILDLYPPGSPAPIRLELWGDEIDTMSYFDLETQRRTDPLTTVSITPAAEVLFDTPLQEKLEALAEKTRHAAARSHLMTDLNRLQSDISLSSNDKYFALAYPEPATLFDYLSHPIVFISEYHDCKERAKNYLWQTREDEKVLLEEGELTPELCCFHTEFAGVQLALSKLSCCYLDTFSHTNRDVAFTDLLTLTAVQTGRNTGDLNLLCEELPYTLEQGYAVLLLAGTAKGAARLGEDLAARGLPARYEEHPQNLTPGRLTVTAGSLSGGFEYPDSRVAVLTLARAAAAPKRTSRFRKGQALKALTDLEKGDLVVHVSHGIGVYEGIQPLEMQGVVKDYIKLSYAGADVLYVPVTQLDLVSKYIGARDDRSVKLNRLHSAEWQKTRSRVKKAVEDMADELIALYAKRMMGQGFAYSPDTEWQKDFEQQFPYAETEDQLQSIEEIKRDMERIQPMDRVLCGDVGFGKTEVAMRACFKAVMDHKQVAVLCPTTILAWQHFQTFRERFSGFPIEIELLSRFRTPKQQKRVLERLADGKVDIVIGTHRLVQKDVQFRDLGLAIIDEEQRFGVRHKERFKELFSGIDVLTLSATPIPRTLNMAISGIRDMSILSMPPQNRLPVQTYVLEYDPGILADAIRKELRRGGQVYYIYNRVETIELCAARIHTAVPEARIAVAHGQMEEHKLSEIWRQLIDHEIDILLCTTIIETGVDVPNCNTLIVENADHLGLSQLYQLRGRVGRSARRAFAYFTFTRGKALSEISTKRLAAIREFTKFGSGFRIAMRDLEIRGAGNILGASQHGHMEAVGYDMYLRLLSDAIAQRKGEEPAPQSYECLIDLRLNAHIPETYIGSSAQRIDIYKKMAAVRTREDCMDMTDELIDRFGDPPESVLSLLEVAYLRNVLAAAGFNEISQHPKELILYPQTLSPKLTSQLLAALPGRVLVNASSRPYYAVRPSKLPFSPLAVLQEVAEVLTQADRAG